MLMVYVDMMWYGNVTSTLGVVGYGCEVVVGYVGITVARVYDPAVGVDGYGQYGVGVYTCVDVYVVVYIDVDVYIWCL